MPFSGPMPSYGNPMTGHWFRYYDGAVDDPKVQRLSPIIFRFWINILCLASRNSGILPSLSDMEFTLRINTKQLSEFIGKLLTAGLLDQDGETLSPHNWNVRQFKSDVSTERVKRFRERHETVPRNAPDTEQSRNRTETEGFEDFYAAFPKKEKKKDARAAYMIALGAASPATILSGAKRYAKTKSSVEDRYITPPEKWLIGEQWEDGLVNGHAKRGMLPEEVIAQNKARAAAGLEPLETEN